MELKFSDTKNKILEWSDSYDYDIPDDEVRKIGECVRVQKNGFLTREQLYRICYWKSAGRSVKHVMNNDEDFVNTITQFALKTKSKRAAIESLTLLDGVGWPTASAILHLCHKQKYPIHDFRALWSLGEENPKQRENYESWLEYVEHTRQLSDKTGVSMRDLDRALWQHSKCKQPKKTIIEKEEKIKGGH